MISYVLPDTSDKNPNGRGGLKGRRDVAGTLGCAYIEMPADFIRNKAEAWLTGLGLCAPLTESAVAKLYEAGSPSPDVQYILRAEPSLSRSDGHGPSCRASIQWYLPEWTSRMAGTLVTIGKRLGAPPAIVEISPGDNTNSFKDVIRAARVIADTLEKAFSARPEIMVTSRTGQILSAGEALAKFMHEVQSEPGLAAGLTVAVDVRRMFSRTRGNLLRELKEIPREALRCVHVPSRPLAPGAPAIPWGEVFSWLKGIPGDVLIQPEARSYTDAHGAIQFCKGMEIGIPMEHMKPVQTITRRRTTRAIRPAK